MTARTLRRCLVPVLVLFGCGHKKLPPPLEQKVTLGERTATYRDYRNGNVCDADPQKLDGDLSSMNALLASFLGQTSARRDGMWADEHIALLTQAEKALPPALDGHQSAVGGLAACDFGPALDVAENLRVGEELARQARKRLAEAPALLTYITARRALEKWTEEQPAAQQAAREQKCPAKPKPGQPPLYFAAQDAGGKTRWLFCDGAQVTADAAGSPQFTLPDRKVAPKPYLDAAAAYPAADVRRPPKLPEP
jgi:hypothetical protein